jgi:hypothetical protein
MPSIQDSNQLTILQEGEGLLAPESCILSAKDPETGKTTVRTAFSLRLREWLSSVSAIGYYTSAALHALAYGFLLLFVYLFGVTFSDPEPEKTEPLAASLADEQVVDDAARLEIVTDLSTGESESESSVEQLANHLRASQDGQIDMAAAEALRTFTASSPSADEGGKGSGLMFKMPEAGLAVTKGSFTAWTEPKNPSSGQNYLIIIQIRLPDDVSRYRLSDLTGEVKGTDNYRQKIPYEPRSPNAAAVSSPSGLKAVRPAESVEVVDHKVQLAIKVPGASRLTQDTIRIRSKRLREDQELILVFGKPAPAGSD